MLRFLFVPDFWLLSFPSSTTTSSASIADRSEFLGWRSQEALLRKVNGVTVRQSLFERTRGLATVRLRMAGSSISIGMIPVTQALAIRDRALYVAETDRRSPM